MPKYTGTRATDNRDGPTPNSTKPIRIVGPLYHEWSTKARAWLEFETHDGPWDTPPVEADIERELLEGSTRCPEI